MSTIEKDWEDFRTEVYPGADLESEQMKQLKACWFSAYIGCLTTMGMLTAESKNVDDGVDLLKSLFSEAETFIMKYAKEEMKRQNGVADC